MGVEPDRTPGASPDGVQQDGVRCVDAAKRRQRKAQIVENRAAAGRKCRHDRMHFESVRIEKAVEREIPQVEPPACQRRESAEADGGAERALPAALRTFGQQYHTSRDDYHHGAHLGQQAQPGDEADQGEAERGKALPLRPAEFASEADARESDERSREDLLAQHRAHVHVDRKEEEQDRREQHASVVAARTMAHVGSDGADRCQADQRGHRHDRQGRCLLAGFPQELADHCRHGVEEGGVRGGPTGIRLGEPPVPDEHRDIRPVPARVEAGFHWVVEQVPHSLRSAEREERCHSQRCADSSSAAGIHGEADAWRRDPSGSAGRLAASCNRPRCRRRTAARSTAGRRGSALAAGAGRA